MHVDELNIRRRKKKKETDNPVSRTEATRTKPWASRKTTKWTRESNVVPDSRTGTYSRRRSCTCGHANWITPIWTYSIFKLNKWTALACLPFRHEAGHSADQRLLRAQSEEETRRRLLLYYTLLMGLNVHSNLLRVIMDGEGRGECGDGFLRPSTYSLHCHRKNDPAGSCARHFNVSLIVWAKLQDSVHKPQFLKRKDSRSGSNRGPSAYHHSALPLGHTGSCVFRVGQQLYRD